jgi:hypothetical protein
LVSLDGNYLSLSAIIGIFPSLLGDIKKKALKLYSRMKNIRVLIAAKRITAGKRLVSS